MASPLGLTFNYSTSTKWSTSEKTGNYKVIDNKNVASLFGNAQFSPFPERGSVDPSSGNVNRIQKGSSVHSDDSYNISVSDIVKYTEDKPSMKLTFADFAYLKNLGVYPNNRLIIARRFASAVGNDLTAIKSKPLSTLISWVKDSEDYLSVEYGEEWVDAEASFVKVLNDIGGELKGPGSDNAMNKLGDGAAAAFNILPLPGFMEGIQYEVMKEMGLTDAGIGNSPLGNPNLIRKAKRRETVDPNSAGSGLSAKFTVKMEVEYEQKFINGVDPTLVYLDIIQNALTFGTSDAAFQFSSAFATGTSNIIGKLISGDLIAIAQALTEFVEKLLNAITNIGKKIIDNLINPPKDDAPKKDEKGNIDTTPIFDAVKKAFASTVGHVISKYKLRLIGIANALTGSPSTPWHVTIGNPKRPIFSSGDMLTTDVTLTLGKTLAFNDLPSSIKIVFSLTNARPLGASEIFNRLNTGRGRSYKRLQQSFVEAPDRGVEPDKQPQNATATSKETPAGNQIVNDKNKDGVDDNYQMTDAQSAAYNGDTYITNSSNVSDWMGGDTPPPEPVNLGESQKDVNGNGDVNPPAPAPEVMPSNQSASTNAGAIAPVAPQPKLPVPEPGTQKLATRYNNTGKISEADDSLLSARSAKIDEELVNTPEFDEETYVDSKGETHTVKYLNSKYEDLQYEKEKIKEEQEDRAGDTNNNNNNTV